MRCLYSFMLLSTLFVTDTCAMLTCEAGQIHVSSHSGWEVISSLEYQARDDSGLAFRTTQAMKVGSNQLHFKLEGPAATQAEVTALATELPLGLILDWTIHYHGPLRHWNNWTSGFTFTFAATITDVATRPIIKWVRPTGRLPWEVKGDTLYPDTEGQLRIVKFKDQTLVMVAPDYDPDWIYGGNKERAPQWRLLPPAAPATKTTYRMVLLTPSTHELTSDHLAALAAQRPLSLNVSTGRLGNLFAPGETVPLNCVVSNVTTLPQVGRIDITVHDYQGRALLTERQPVRLLPGERQIFRHFLHPPDRGVLFVDTLLSWTRGHQPARTTIGILPERRNGDTSPDSPFALAGAIASPHLYPDHWDLDTVLSHAERIGVRWVRGGWLPLQEQMSESEVDRTRQRLELLHQHGMLPHVQMGATVPKPEEIETFKATLRRSLQRFPDVGKYMEVVNELNYSATGAEYVQRLLRPVYEVMRDLRPDAKIMTMGFGGVMRDWLQAFVNAGGMELADVLSIHPGCQPRAPEFWEEWTGWVFRPQVQDALAAARQAGGKEVWITEAYAPTNHFRSSTDLRTSADYLVRTYVSAIAAGVRVIEWYQFQDGVWFAQRPYPGDVEYSFGMVYTDLTPKPQYVAFGAMTEQLEGATYLGRLDLGAEDLYGVRFARQGKTCDVLWSYREKHETDLGWWPPEQFANASRRPGEPWEERWKAPVTVTLPASTKVEVTDLMGNRRSVRATAGSVQLDLTGSPLYVRGLGEIPLRQIFWDELP